MKIEYGEFTAKTVEEAVKLAVDALQKSEDELEIEVLEEGKPGGLFGIGAVKAKIKVSLKEKTEPVKEQKTAEKTVKKEKKPQFTVRKNADGVSDGERAVAFLKGLMPLLNVDAEPLLVKEEEKIIIDLKTENTHAVIGKHGVMLDAVQNLAGAVANIGRDNYKRVVVDCDHYREDRDKTLAHVAEKTAAKAVRLGKKVSLEPMSAYERRIIHSTLANSTEVKTVSEGKEPRRRVVVIPNELRAYDGKKRGDRRGGNGGRSGKDGPFNRDRRNGERRPFRQYTEEEKRARSQVSGGTGIDGGTDGAAYKKNKSLVFGTFLGNNLKDKKEDGEE